MINKPKKRKIGVRLNAPKRTGVDVTTVDDSDRTPSSESLGNSSFEIIKVIGTGSFGKAILVRNRKDGKNYVMKRINVKEMSEDERQGAMNEVKVLQLLKHQNIIAYHEYFQSNDGHLNIIMDYADGGDMFQRIRKQNNHWFSEDMILDWFIQIALGLKHVHDNNILHRDLKTQNIFLTSDNTIKLGDFGIAKILNSQTELANTVIGTPYYLSPELCEDKPYNQKSDVWALGCVLYEITTLKHAFNGQNLPALVLKIVRGRYPPIPPQYSDDLRQLISSMLQKDPELRPTIEEIIALPMMQKRISKFIINMTTKQSSSTSVNLLKENSIEKIQVSVVEENDKDCVWLENKEKELQSLYNHLHPSKKLALDTVSKNEQDKIVADRQRMLEDKKKNRKEYYAQQLAERKNSGNGANLSQTVKVDKSVKENPQPRKLSQNNPRASVQPSVQNQQVRASVSPQIKAKNFDPQEIIATKFSDPIASEEKLKHDRIKREEEIRKMKLQQEEEMKQAEARKRLEEKQESKERKAWLDQMSQNDIKHKKKQFLEEKKREKQRKLDEEKKKLLDHKKKMQAIKGRQRLLNPNAVSSPSQSDKLPMIVSETTEPKQNVVSSDVYDEKLELEKQKEEERKQALVKHRQNLKAFINQQKQKKKGSDIEIEVVAGDFKPSSSVTQDDKRVPIVATQDVQSMPDLPKKSLEPPVKSNSQNEKRKQSGFSGFLKAKKTAKKVEASPPVEILVKEQPPTKLILSNNSDINDSTDSIEIEESHSRNSTPPKKEDAESSLEIEEMVENEDPNLSNELNTLDIVEAINDKLPEEPKMPSNQEMLKTLKADKHAAMEEVREEHSVLADDPSRYLLDHNVQQMAPLEQQTAIPDNQQKLSIRIEYLRQYCETKFGEDLFLRIYRYLREAGENDDENEMHENLLELLGNNASLHYPYVQKVHQLIFCEDMFYSH